MISMILAALLVPQVQDTAPKPVPIAPIVVTVTRAPLEIMKSPLPAMTLGREQLSRDVRPSFAAVATEIPGVRAVTTGAIIAKPVIRGLGGARVLALDAGHRLEDYSWSDEDGPSLDPRLAERIEVIRGPASLLYGSDAIGGVVNSIPEELIEAAPGQRFRRLRTEIFGASNNPGIGAGANAAWARNAWSARLNLVGHFAGPVITPDCELENTGFSSLNGEAAVGVHGASGRASLRVSRFAGEFKLLEAGGAGFSAPPGCPGGPPKPATETESGPERKVDDLRVQLGGETRWHGLGLEARAQFQHHGTIELSDDVNPGVETETINLGLTTSTVDLLAHHRLGRLEGTLGVSGLHQQNASTGAAALVPDGSINNGAAFIVERLPLGRISLLGGVRVDARRLHADSNTQLALGAQDRNASAVTADFGAVVEVARGLALAANVGRAFRAPNLFELFANGPRLGEARYEIGDASMTPEISRNLDVSLRWQQAHFRGEVAVFHNEIGGFIFITPTTQFRQTGTPASPDSLRVWRYGQSKARLNGGEVSLAFDPAEKLTLWARGDVVTGDDVTRHSPLPEMPPQRVVTGARYHAAESSPHHWYVGAEVEAVDNQDRTARYVIPGQGVTAFELATSGYALLGFEGGAEVHLGSRLLHLDGRLRNALDTSYRNYLSRYKEFALDAGRSIEVRLATEF